MMVLPIARLYFAPWWLASDRFLPKSWVAFTKLEQSKVFIFGSSYSGKSATTLGNAAPITKEKTE
jgi:hypothetical protein